MTDFEPPGAVRGRPYHPRTKDAALPLAPRKPRARHAAESRRRILLVCPRFSRSMANMHHAWPAVGARAFSPPLGLLVIASYLPEGWETRLVDESVRRVTAADLAWADAVFVSGMHIQRRYIDDVLARSRAAGKVTVLGGPSVSACPSWYPDADLLHIGELGDATDAIVARLDRDVGRPAGQERYTSVERVPMDAFPIPAYGLVDFGAYMMGTVQFSSGCPYLCEFCDIPSLYGRDPRLKTTAQLLSELDALLAVGNPGVVFFVDDNLIANRRAAAELLRELALWQERRGRPLAFACEATLNLAESPDMLESMRQALFTILVCGVETPEPEALRQMHKEQNTLRPVAESVGIFNRYGLHVVAGIILGLDGDTPATGERLASFIEESRIPMLTLNVLQALPGTPLSRRLEAEGRLLPGSEGGSNVKFLLPEEMVYETWREGMRRAYEPDALFARIDHQFRETFPNRKRVRPTRERATARNVARGFRALGYVLWHLGVRAPYRARFWRTALPALRRGQVEELIEVATIAHHVIAYTADVLGGSTRPGLYEARPEG